jgi:hypothetical protein
MAYIPVLRTPFALCHFHIKATGGALAQSKLTAQFPYKSLTVHTMSQNYKNFPAANAQYVSSFGNKGSLPLPPAKKVS